jgi:hypothetical protein
MPVPIRKVFFIPDSLLRGPKLSEYLLFILNYFTQLFLSRRLLSLSYYILQAFISSHRASPSVTVLSDKSQASVFLVVETLSFNIITS